jgi:hypothetical protein
MKNPRKASHFNKGCLFNINELIQNDILDLLKNNQMPNNICASPSLDKERNLNR